MNHRPIYLDTAAATPLDERVFAAQAPYLKEQFYNPSAAYLAARRVRQAVNQARHTIAQLIGAKPTEVIMTAGATESVNIALQGVLRMFPTGQLLTDAAEHEAVLALAKARGEQIIGVDAHGFIIPAELEKAISARTVIISIGLVNNELGTVQPLKVVVALVQRLRSQRLADGNDLPLYVHTDASQAVGHLDLHTSRLGVDLMTLSAAKAYGPKQAGVLYVRSGVQLQPLLYGGGQEGALRSGTENVAGIIGCAEALRIAEDMRPTETFRLRQLRDHLVSAIVAALPDTIINSPKKRLSPHILNLSFPGIDGERLVMELDERGIMVATGSACAANRGTRSHVLAAIGLNDELIRGSLRLSFGRFTTETDLQRAANELIACVRHQKERA